MKLKRTPRPNIFDPAQVTTDMINNVQSLAMLLANGDQRKAHDYVLLYSAYGHHFGYDMGRTITQGYVLKGKATLGADAMAGICRSSGKVRFIKIVEWGPTVCSMLMARTDEPKDVVHRYTFTIDMAAQQGLTRQQNWSKMPMQMLRARCLTMGLRATFPDCVSGIYSVDEMADSHDDLDDYERTMITAQSMGEEVRISRGPQPSRAPQPSRGPQPSRAPQPSQPPQFSHEEIRVDSERPARNRRKLRPDERYVHTPTRADSFTDDDRIIEAYANIGMDQGLASRYITERGNDLREMTPIEHETFFYRWSFFETIREDGSLPPEWWTSRTTYSHVLNKLQADYPILSQLEHSDITRAFIEVNAPFFEMCKVSNSLVDNEILMTVALNSMRSIITKEKGMEEVYSLFNRAKN